MKEMYHSNVFSAVVRRFHMNRTFHGDPIMRFVLSCGHTREERESHCGDLPAGARMECTSCPTPPEAPERMKQFEESFFHAAPFHYEASEIEDDSNVQPPARP